MANIPTNPLFELGDLLPGDILVVIAPKDDNDDYWFKIPGCQDVVWVLTITEIRSELDGNLMRWFVTGFFYKNPTRDLTDPLIKDNHTYAIDFLEGALIEVYGEDDNLIITSSDIKRIKSNLKKIVKWEADL